MQAAKTQASHDSVSHGDSTARSQSGVLHSSKHLPSVQPICVLFQSRQLVWLGTLDLLELSKFACAACGPTSFEIFARPAQSQHAPVQLTLGDVTAQCFVCFSMCDGT